MTRTRNETQPGSGLSTEQSIVNDTYLPNNPTDEPSIKKKARVTLHQDEDTNFECNSSGAETVSPANNNGNKNNNNNIEATNEYDQRLPPEPTLASISQDAQNLNASIHNPHMIVDLQSETPINNQHNNRTTPPEPQDQQIIPSMETTQTLQIEHISLDDPKKETLLIYYSFLIKEEFGNRSISQISEIITEICGSLPGFLKIENSKEKFNHVEIIKISFVNETSRNSLSNVTNKRYNITFHNYDKTSLETQTNHYNKQKEERTIKVVEVPRSFSVKNIKDIFTTYGKIRNIFRVDKSTNNQRQAPSGQNRRPSQYNTFFIEYQNKEPAQKFFKEAIWTVKIDRYLVKILPSNPEDIEYKNRTLFRYKITGLYKDTNFYDLEPIINKIKGKTCTLPEPNPRQITRTAYVNVHSEDYEKKIRVVNFNKDRQIYITPIETPTCTICGHYEHDFTNCTNKEKLETFLRNPKDAKISPDENNKSSIPYQAKRGRNYSFNNDHQINKPPKNVSYNHNTNNNNSRRQRSSSRSRRNLTNDIYHWDVNNVDNTVNNNKILQLEKNLSHLTSRVNEIKLTQQQLEQTITTISQQYREVTEKIKEIQTTLESINRIDQTQNTILQMVKEIKDQRSIPQRNSRSPSPRFSPNNSRRKSTDRTHITIPTQRSKHYQDRSPTYHNINEQQSDYTSDYQEYQAQQTDTSSQQEYFPPHNEDTEEIEIRTVTAHSETTGQPAFNLSNLIPTSWGVYPNKGQ
ncbi:hypothetical protein RclHR1_02880010 [Rhizophagus clarus]|nr:hypothetical protein RclHR1_02880010 [Rhizophagus clarus]